MDPRALSAVQAISLANGAIITNGLSDELGQAIHEVFIVQQLASVGPLHARSPELTVDR
jgi:hypothetical protein